MADTDFAGNNMNTNNNVGGFNMNMNSNPGFGGNNNFNIPNPPQCSATTKFYQAPLPYPSLIPMNNQSEINFININIAPSNGITQNIYMNFPPTNSTIITQPQMMPPLNQCAQSKGTK